MASPSVRLVPCCLTLLLAAFVLPILGYPSGAPDGVCDNDLTPGHGKQGKKTNAYQLTASPNDDGSFSVQIQAKGEPTFKGFVVQVQDKKGTPQNNGEWHSDSGKAISKCAAATHTSPDEKTKVRLTWTPNEPVNSKDLTFVATVLKEYSTYYKNIKGSVKGSSKASKQPTRAQPTRTFVQEQFPTVEESDPEAFHQFDISDPQPDFPVLRTHPPVETHSRPIPHWALRAPSRPHWDAAVESQPRPWESSSESHSEPAQSWDGGAVEPQWQTEEHQEEPQVFQSHLPPSPPPRKAKRPTSVKARRPIASTSSHGGSFEEPFTRHTEAFWAPINHHHHIQHVQPQHILPAHQFQQNPQGSQPQLVRQAQSQEDELDSFFHQPTQHVLQPQASKVPVRSHFRQQPRQRFRQAIRQQRFQPQRVQQQQQHQPQEDEEETIDFAQERAPMTRVFQPPTRFTFRHPTTFQIRHF